MKEGPPILAVLPPQADSVLPNDMESSTNILVTPNPVVNGTIYPDLISLDYCGILFLLADVKETKKYVETISNGEE